VGNPNNHEVGARGENLAADFLRSNDFQIIERNYRYGKYGEIDIIARKSGLIIFTEVKNRRSQRHGGALYSISSRKKKSLKSAARAFIAARPEFNRPDITFRFDLISVSEDAIDWIEDMFR
jgi:putative endonuclease